MFFFLFLSMQLPIFAIFLMRLVSFNLSWLYSGSICDGDSSPAGMRLPWEVPWRSFKGPKSHDFQGTLRGLTQQLIVQLKKYFFRCNSPCFTNVLLFFLEKQIFKSSKRGRRRDPVAGPPGDQMMGRSGDVDDTCFSNSTQKHIKITLTGCSRLYSEL